MNENVKRILKLVEEGKIDASKAAELIDALNDKEPVQEPAPSNKEKSLKVRVLSGKGETVNVNLPLKFLKSSLKAFGKIPINIQGDKNYDIDVQSIADAIESGVEGKIVDIKSDNGDSVEVVIE